jgi:hypothetical protein
MTGIQFLFFFSESDDLHGGMNNGMNFLVPHLIALYFLHFPLREAKRREEVQACH